jgi:hypothetical protein
MAEGCCRRGAVAAWPSVAGSFTLGGGSREMGRGRRGEPAARRGHELSRAVEGADVGEVLAAGLPRWWLSGGAVEGERRQAVATRRTSRGTRERPNSGFLDFVS